MATYRKATEKDISKGKGKSTDELSLAEATTYFNKRAGETGAKKFRYKGEVYDLSGEKAPTAAPKSSAKAADDKPMRPRARPAAPEKTVNTVRPEVPQKPKAAAPAPKKYSGRGEGASEVSRRKTDAARRAQEDMSDKAKKVAAGGAALGAAAIGARAALKSPPKAPRKPATPNITNPKYGSKSGMKEGFQGKMETGIARPGPASRTGGRGLAGNPAPFEQISGGGKVSRMPDDEPFLFNKGGMVKKGKK